MEKEFVPHKLALRLKAIGFDGPTEYSWIVNKVYPNGIIGHSAPGYNYNKNDEELSAPTFSQAFRWFRNKYNLYYQIDKQGYWFFSIKKDEGYGDLTEIISIYDFDSNDDAELACLEKLIEIVELK